MLILDSNLWIHGFTIGGGYPDDCIDRFVEHAEEGAVNAYIHREVVENIDDDRVIPRDVRNDAIRRFCRLVDECSAIDNCSQEAIDRMDLDSEREEIDKEIIGALADIQPKDVPIFVLAYRNRNQRPTICTDDESFAEFSPSEYGLDEISIEHVPVSWERVERPAE